MWRPVPGALTSSGSASPTKQGSIVMPSPCRTAAICVSPSVVLNGTPAARTSPSRAQSEIPFWLTTIHRMGSGAPHAMRQEGHGTCRRRRTAPVPSGRED